MTDDSCFFKKNFLAQPTNPVGACRLRHYLFLAKALSNQKNIVNLRQELERIR
jgi:hypothetical protein